MAMRVEIEYVPAESLTPSQDNPRQHPPSQIRQLTKAIKELGFINPIIVDQDGVIVAGHARLIAAQCLKIPNLPVIRMDHLTKAEIRAYRLADNKLVENGEWNNDLLRIELNFLVDAGFDTEITGFSTTEIDLILQDMPVSDLEDGDPADAEAIDVPVTRPGDIFLLDDHKILCADIRCQSAIQQFMGDERADAVFTDPPFNVPVGGHVSGLGKIKHDEFAMASGEMDTAQFQEFLHTSMGNMVRVSRNGAVHFVCMDWRHLHELYSAAIQIYHTQLNLCIWNKTNAGMGSLYRSQHEFIGVYRVGKTPHQNNVQLGKNGRYRTNVWTYAGMNSFGANRDESLAMHPTVKPVALIADALLDVTSRGDVILDGFLGSGSTLIAAAQIGRIAYGIEIDPRYVDVSIDRWQTLTGHNAIHAESGLTFAELAAERLDTQPAQRD
jgi:DNA modification methylase